LTVNISGTAGRVRGTQFGNGGRESGPRSTAGGKVNERQLTAVERAFHAIRRF